MLTSLVQEESLSGNPLLESKQEPLVIPDLTDQDDDLTREQVTPAAMPYLDLLPPVVGAVAAETVKTTW